MAFAVEKCSFTACRVDDIFACVSEKYFNYALHSLFVQRRRILEHACGENKRSIEKRRPHNRFGIPRPPHTLVSESGSIGWKRYGYLQSNRNIFAVGQK